VIGPSDRHAEDRHDQDHAGNAEIEVSGADERKALAAATLRVFGKEQPVVDRRGVVRFLPNEETGLQRADDIVEQRPAVLKRDFGGDARDKGSSENK